MENNLDKYKEYLLARGKSLNYRNIMRIWLKYLNEQKIEIITQETITQFFNNKNYSLKSRNQFISGARDYYSAYMQVPKEQNEFFKIKLLKGEKKIPDFMPEEEIEEAKKYLITYYRKMTPQKIRTLIDFLFDTGVRKGELLNLRRENFILDENSAKVLGKGRKERFVVYSEKTKKELVDYFVSENEENNCFNLTLGKIHYIMKLLKKYMNKRIYCHLFRHSAGRDIIAKGGDLTLVATQFGHTSTKTTEIYTMPNYEGLRKNFKRVKG